MNWSQANQLSRRCASLEESTTLRRGRAAAAIHWRAITLTLLGCLCLAVTQPAQGQSCGDADAGDCCTANGTPGCSDAACCEAICACDPFCCDTQWDSICASDGLNGNGCGAEVLCNCEDDPLKVLTVPGMYPTIQEAINDAQDGYQVLVAPGTYEEDIQIVGVDVHVKSEQGPEVTTIANDLAGGNVVYSTQPLDSTPILEGFTITGGDGSSTGGGMYLPSSNLTVKNCIIAGNEAVNGGGVVVFAGSPHFIDCVIKNNSANFGGGLYVTDQAEPIFENCVIEDNVAAVAGGGVYSQSLGTNFSTQATFLNCTFGNNIANGTPPFGGGAMYNHRTAPTVTGCLFLGNSAPGGNGGAVFNEGENSSDLNTPEFSNCLFFGNTAEDDLSVGGAMYNKSSQPTITGCEFGNNSAPLTGGAVRSEAGGNALVASSAFCNNNPNHLSGTWTDNGGNTFESECEPINVPADYDTIQLAIDAAFDGDEVIVAPGTYNEVVDFKGKAIHLRSSDGPDVTTIDATGLDNSAVLAITGEGSDTILEGFTITGGTGHEISTFTFVGGGMTIKQTSPTVIDCVFTENSAQWGGGMYVIYDSQPSITDCVFADNTAWKLGGGIWVSQTNADVEIQSTFFCGNMFGHIEGPWTDLGGNEFSDTCDPGIPGDLDGDGVVGVSDLLQLLGAWGACDCPEDLDDDGFVGVSDLLTLLANWG